MQREVIQDVLAGRDVLCVMPTGAGKSLCYQLPAVARGGLTIVVSPLISLMADQVRQLRDRSIRSAVLNSSQSSAEQRQVLQELREGFEGLLYVAPERFFAPGFMQQMNDLRITLLAVDEAHCVSQWGHDFRREYSRLGEIRQQLGAPPTIALTATATDDVRQDIVHSLHLHEPSVVITGFDRPNLSYEAHCIERLSEKDEIVHRLIKAAPTVGSGIIYCATRKKVDSVSIELARQFPGRVLIPYHAGLDQADRTRNQQLFMTTPGSVVVATNAFGMGINKPDIRFVIHYDIPGTLEAYYQEAGRAGRDGLPSTCTLIYHFGDRRTQEFFIDRIGQDSRDEVDEKWIDTLKQRATAKLDLVTRYARIARCRRQQILDYFGDEQTVNDCACDVCRGSLVEEAVGESVTLIVRQILAGVARMNGKFGLNAVAEVLTGVSSERTQRWELDKLSVFGILKQHPSKTVVAMMHRVVEAGLARSIDRDGTRRPVIELTSHGAKVMKAEEPPPGVLANLVPQTRVARVSATVRKRDRKPDVDDTVQLDGEAQRRFDRLKQVRSSLAKEHDLPAYIVCQDKTLVQLAHQNPVTLEAMELVKGIGPHKVRLYGEHFLTALSG